MPVRSIASLPGHDRLNRITGSSGGLITTHTYGTRCLCHPIGIGHDTTTSAPARKHREHNDDEAA